MGACFHMQWNCPHNQQRKVSGSVSCCMLAQPPKQLLVLELILSNDGLKSTLWLFVHTILSKVPVTWFDITSIVYLCIQTIFLSQEWNKSKILYCSLYSIRFCFKNKNIKKEREKNSLWGKLINKIVEMNLHVYSNT